MVMSAQFLYLITNRFVQFIVSLRRMFLILLMLRKINRFMLLSLLAVAWGPALVAGLVSSHNALLSVVHICLGFMRSKPWTMTGWGVMREHLVLFLIAPSLGLIWILITLNVYRVDLLALDHMQLVWTKGLRRHPLQHKMALFPTAHGIDVDLLRLDNL